MTIADKLTLLEQTKEAQRVKLGLPKSLPFSRYYEFFEYKFDSRYLFLNGEQGIWLDPSDLNAVYQAPNGINQPTPNSSIGLILDKSQGLLGEGRENISVARANDGLTYSDGDIFIDYKGGETSEISFTPVTSATTSLSFTLEYLEGPKAPIFVYPNSIYAKSVQEDGYYKMFSNDAKGFLIFRVQRGSQPFKARLRGVRLTKIRTNHIKQGVTSARPTYRTDGTLHWLEFDGVDDTLSVQLPSGVYTEIKASRDGVTHNYPVNVNGTYTIGNLTQTKQSVSGLVLVNRQLTQAEIVNVTNLMKVKAGLTL